MGITGILNRTYISWMDAKGPESDIVISSRVRLARNLHQVPFPHLLDENSGKKVMEKVNQALAADKNGILKGLELVPLSQLSSLDRSILLEKHLVSPEHADSTSLYRGVVVNEDGSLAIMVNEEDHLRIQCVLSGLQLNQAHKYTEMADDALESVLDYAFEMRRGYLTSCPTNSGTGIRASVMLHLPATAMTNQTNLLVQSITQFGLTVRGMYGEGTEATGKLYQVSNQVTLGQSEEDIINNLWTVVLQIVEQERHLRERLLKEMKYQVEDRVLRSYGILSNARIITSSEALALLSDVRMGVDMNILPETSRQILNELIVAIKPSHLQRAAGKEMDTMERDLERAKIIKAKLQKKSR
jgi:protein arginine kinase